MRQVKKTHRFDTVTDLIKLLSNIPNPDTCYVFDSGNDTISRLDIVEETLTDGSKVTDVRLRPFWK